MNNSKKSMNQVEIQKMSLEDLNTILDENVEPNAPINTETVLMVLEMIEHRVGKESSPSLDAAWERIKRECLL